MEKTNQKSFDEAQISKFEQVVLVLLVLLGLMFVAVEHGGTFVGKVRTTIDETITATRTAAAEWLCPENQTCSGATQKDLQP